MNTVQTFAPLISWIAQVTPAPGPDEPNPMGQVILGLGLSGAMLIGFLLLVAILIGAMLAIGWSAHRDEHRHGHGKPA